MNSRKWNRFHFWGETKKKDSQKTFHCSNKFYSLASILCAACAELIALFCNEITQRKRTSEKSMILIFQLHNRRCDILSLSCDSAPPTTKTHSFHFYCEFRWNKTECGARVFTLRAHVMISVRMHTNPHPELVWHFYWNWIIEYSFENPRFIICRVGKKERRNIQPIPIKIKTVPR